VIWSAGDRERCLAAGKDAYVTKPLRPAELFAAIDKLLAPPEQFAATASPPQKAAGQHSNPL
jgi:CheY-like chemotaxis protein